MSVRAVLPLAGRKEESYIVCAPSRLDSKVALVVEDDFLLRLEIVEHLHEQGCVVLEADSGEQAIAMQCTPVDVLVTDINLGGVVTGWDVAEAFRTARPRVAVVYTSSNCADRSRCVNGSRFFNKPCNMSDITEACGLST